MKRKLEGFIKVYPLQNSFSRRQMTKPLRFPDNLNSKKMKAQSQSIRG